MMKNDPNTNRQSNHQRRRRPRLSQQRRPPHRSHGPTNNSIAFLELKYGNINGGYPNFYAISEIAFLAFEPGSNKVFIDSWSNAADIDIISVYAKVNELGHTIDRVKEVVNMRTNRIKPYDEEFRLEERDLEFAFKKLRPSQMHIKRFLGKVFKKYRFRDVVVFDGHRDVFLCERAGANFSRINIIDIQKDLNKETNYLFSLNKLSVVINFEFDGAYLRSNNLEYWLHPIAAQQIMPKSAAYDAARLLMVYQEYVEHKDDMLIKAAQLLEKIKEVNV